MAAPANAAASSKPGNFLPVGNLFPEEIAFGLGLSNIRPQEIAM
jgi:hypothetical protein